MKSITRMNKMSFLTVCLLFGLQGVASGTGNAYELSVDQAVSTALETNLNLQLQRIEVEASQGAIGIESGAFDPTIEAGVTSQEDRMTSLIAGGAQKEETTAWTAAIKKKLQTGTEVGMSWENSRYESDSALAALNPAYNSALEVNFSQPLWQGNSKEMQTARIQAAQKSTTAAEYLVDKKAADLAAQVKQAYWELLFARQDIEVKKLSLKLAEKLHDETSKKIENGILGKVEIYQPLSEIAKREEGLIAAEKQIANKEDSLKLLMNNRNWELTMVLTDTPTIPAKTPDLHGVLKNALSKRADIRATDLQVDSAEILLTKAEDDLRPSVALVGSAGFVGMNNTYNDAVDNSFLSSDFSWKLGLSLNMPIGNTSARGSLAQARAKLAKSRLSVELLRQQVENDARKAVRDVTLAMKTIEATRKTSLAAQKQLEAEEAKFKVGLATANDVLESQNAYAGALASENRALVDLAKAQAVLDRVQGLVSFRHKAQKES